MFKILSIKLLASNSRIFGFFHLKYFFSPVNDLCQNQGFLDLFKVLSIKLLASNSRIFGFFHLKYFLVQWITHVIIKDFWIFSKLYLFNSLHQIQGFLDFFTWYIFSVKRCQNQGFSDFFKDSNYFTLRIKVKDFWIFFEIFFWIFSKYYLFNSLHQIQGFL